MLRKSVAVSVCLVLIGGLGCLVAIPVIRGQTHTPTVISKDLTSYRDVVKSVLPAVVSIETKTKALPQAKSVTPLRKSFDNLWLPDPFGKLFDEFSVPNVPQRGFGSGFVVDPKGVIVTNYHVVKNADQVVVQLQDGRRFTSHDIKSDPKTDLALVRIDAKGSLPYLQWGNSNAMEIGDRVLAVGAPFGLRGSVTAGIVSGKGRNADVSLYEDFVQTDAAINPGNSGGPLVSLDGKVVGVTTAIKSHSGGSQGVGLAIASNMAKSIMDQLLAHGSVHRGYLGMQIRTLDSDVATRLGIPAKSGVLVSQVLDGAPAAKAGIQAGDVITALAGTSIKEARELQRFVTAQTTGKSIEVTLFRDGHEKRIPVTVAEQPQEFRTVRTSAAPLSQQDHGAVRMDRLGFEFRDMTPDLAQQWGYKEQSGVIITQVNPGSMSAEAGLGLGMVLVKVNNHAVHSAAEARQALETASLEAGILLQLRTPQHGVEFIMLRAIS